MHSGSDSAGCMRCLLILRSKSMFLIVWAFLLSCLAVEAQVGIVIFKNNQAYPDDLAKGVEYFAKQTKPPITTYAVLGSKTVRLTDFQVVLDLAYIDLDSRDYFGHQHLPAVRAHLDRLSAVSKKYPRVADVLAEEISRAKRVAIKLQTNHHWTQNRWWTNDEHRANIAAIEENQRSFQEARKVLSQRREHEMTEQVVSDASETANEENAAKSETAVTVSEGSNDGGGQRWDVTSLEANPNLVSSSHSSRSAKKSTGSSDLISADPHVFNGVRSSVRDVNLNSKKVEVQPYVRSDGTSVSGHLREPPGGLSIGDKIESEVTGIVVAAGFVLIEQTVRGIYSLFQNDEPADKNAE